jgi:hypothetical protein
MPPCQGLLCVFHNNKNFLVIKKLIIFSQPFRWETRGPGFFKNCIIENLKLKMTVSEFNKTPYETPVIVCRNSETDGILKFKRINPKLQVFVYCNGITEWFDIEVVKLKK